MAKPLYGNPIRKGSTRFFGWLPPFALALGAAVCVIVLVAFITGFWLFALGTLIVSLVGLLLFGIPLPSEDLTLAQRWMRRWRHAARRRRGETMFLNSHFSDRTPDELLGLPGYLRTINTIPVRDGVGKQVEVLHHTEVDMGTVTFM